MDETSLLERISVDPAICGGKPCVRGHRIWVSLVLGLLADGMTVADIVADYPGLEEADVRACRAYGAVLADVRSSSWQTPPREVQARREPCRRHASSGATVGGRR